MRAFAKTLTVAAAKSRAGRRLINGVVKADPDLGVQALAPTLNRHPRFATTPLPENLDGFEDLAFLFASTPLNHGIVSVSIAEAAHLYRLAKNATRIAEIGRYKGGSTFLLAAAMPHEAELWSYDIHVKLQDVHPGAQLDRELADVLERYGLSRRVHVLVADSATATEPEHADLVFVDGDHTYEGVLRDFEHWAPRVTRGGHLVFHDRGAAGVAALLREIEADPRFRRAGGEPGTLAHLRRN